MANVIKIRHANSQTFYNRNAIALLTKPLKKLNNFTICFNTVLRKLGNLLRNTRRWRNCFSRRERTPPLSRAAAVPHVVFDVHPCRGRLPAIRPHRGSVCSSQERSTAPHVCNYFYMSSSGGTHGLGLALSALVDVQPPYPRYYL